MKKVLSALAKRVKKIRSGLREKPSFKVDEFELEHFLLYNGLVGTSPEDQPSYKEVRNDIVQAVNDNSPEHLAIALKLHPLWWEDRLEKIFGEIAAINRKGLVYCLLAERPPNDITGDTTPLSHSDWRVRSNAARMLAFLAEDTAVPKLCRVLLEAEGEQKSSYCHIAQALGRFGGNAAREALCSGLSDKEPWIRVDAVSALAFWPLEDVSEPVLAALLAECILDDYMAVVFARRHSLEDLSSIQTANGAEGFAQLLLAIFKGLDGPFHSEHHLAEQLAALQPRVNELARKNPSPRLLQAAILLNSRLENKEARRASKENYSEIRDLSHKDHYESVRLCLAEAKLEEAADIGQYKSALALASRFRLSELAPALVPHLRPGFSALPELLCSIGQLGEISAAEPIAELLKNTLDLQKRNKGVFSAHPVIEDDKAGSDIYWFALKALGSLPHESSLQVLKLAVQDHAPDKREQALLSLQQILLVHELQESHPLEDLKSLLKERIDDPAVGVQTASLKGIAQHNFAEMIPLVLKSLQSKETAVHKAAFATLLSLADNGQANSVKQALSEALVKEMDRAKKARLERVLQEIS